jgi:hypothetical protein
VLHFFVLLSLWFNPSTVKHLPFQKQLNCKIWDHSAPLQKIPRSPNPSGTLGSPAASYPPAPHVTRSRLTPRQESASRYDVSLSLPLSAARAFAHRSKTHAGRNSAPGPWLLYGCFICIGLDGNAKDGKSTEAHELEKRHVDKTIGIID